MHQAALACEVLPISELGGTVQGCCGAEKDICSMPKIDGMQVIEPQVKAYLYTWGEGRNTAEGEHIPVRIESLDIGYIDGQLLLPLIEEHTIDERSPLCGHTYMSLKAVGCPSTGNLLTCSFHMHLVLNMCNSVPGNFTIFPTQCVVHSKCIAVVIILPS